ncbi:FecR family protein [Pedobacter sp. N23S346]|uniref:FecR family protein n=1 Tax=Pedobacter sp. N23S346 TaxID=3402750 RepID=UPI003AD6A608
MEERVKFLVAKFESGQLATDEKTELLSLVEKYPSIVSAEITNMLYAYESAQAQPDSENIDHDKWNQVIDHILSVDRLVAPKKHSIKIYFKWLAAAAVLALALAVTLRFQNNREKKHVFLTDIAPGGNKATLTLANGRKISLNDIADGDLIKEAGLSISKTTSGQLVYNIEKNSATADDNQVNIISTPNGGEWQIRLPDGSTVWLNATSSLEYPINIGTTTVRKVKLKGEAYFEVAKDSKHPFIVETDKQKLEVLGTHFNINSYTDESLTKTTLLEGSVRISAINNSNEYEVLKPGQQSVLSENGIEIKAVDSDESVAWKNGYFMFNNEKQESILRKIARWYNVKVEYADKEAKDVMYYGTVSRFDKISQVLRKFEQTGEVRFEMQGNKLIVYKD